MWIHILFLYTAGQLSADISSMATAMISFLQQFQHFLPAYVRPINPDRCVEVLQRKPINIQLSRVRIKWYSNIVVVSLMTRV